MSSTLRPLARRTRVARFRILYHDALERELEALRGKKLRTGLRGTLDALAADPCNAGAYRLAGPLGEFACGIHLAGDYRLAFTITLDPDRAGKRAVYLLWIGRKNPEQPRRLPPFWEFLHELFGEQYHPGRTEPDRLPCCHEKEPEIDPARLEEFDRALARAIRRRQPARRKPSRARRRR